MSKIWMFEVRWAVMPNTKKGSQRLFCPSQSSLGCGHLRPACLCLVTSEMGYSALWDVLICTNETSGLNLQCYRTQITKPWKVPETLRDVHLNSSSFFFFKDLDILLHLLWVVVVVGVWGVVFMPREIFYIASQAPHQLHGLMLTAEQNTHTHTHPYNQNMTKSIHIRALLGTLTKTHTHTQRYNLISTLSGCFR